MRYEFKEFEIKERIIIDGDEELQLIAPCVHFAEKVVIRNCKIILLDIYGVYFFEGIEISNCKVMSDVMWQSGGHNKKKIIISNTIFKGFVDFEDCWFENDIIFQNVCFEKGTNLKGNIGTPVEIIFDGEVILENVTGEMDVNTFFEY